MTKTKRRCSIIAQAHLIQHYQKSTSARGHKFTFKERATGRHDSDIQESMDDQLLVARDAVHQYVTMVGANMAGDADGKLPSDFLAKRAQIVGKIVRLVRREPPRAQPSS